MAEDQINVTFEDDVLPLDHWLYLKENMKTDLRDYSRKMSNKSEESTDPLIVLDTFSSSLNNHGGLKDAKEVEIITTIMKNSSKLVGKFMCLYVLQVTDTEVLESFVRNGGWGVLNKFLAQAKDTSNVQLQAEVMKLIQILPLKIGHLKENNTAKLVKSLSKSTNNKGIKVAATSLMEKFMNVIHGTTNSNSNEISSSKKIKLKEKLKSKSSKVHDNNNKESSRKHSNETKSVPVLQVRSKFRKTGLEESSEPTKKKGKLDKRIPLKRNSGGGNDAEMPADKKNKTEKQTPPEKQKKITISGGFMDALNSLPQVPQKRVKRKISRPQNNTTVTNAANNNNKDVANNDPAPSPEKEEEKKPEEPSKPKLNRFGKPMKNVTWHPEDRLTSVRYFEVLDNERVNVTTQGFKDAMLREHMFERQNLKGNKTVDGDRSWRKPHPLDLQDSLAERGSKSIEKEVQREREKTVLQVIYLYKENVPDSPMEPDPEPYEVVQPPIIPLVDENNPDEEESSQPDNKNILTAFSDNVANSNVGDLKEKLKEILQTASAITPGTNPQQPQLPPQQPIPPMYANQMPMGMPPPNMNMPPPPGGFYPMPPIGQNYNNPPQWQQPQYPPMPPQQHHQYRPYNNHQRPPWNNRGRPRHAR